MTRTFDLAVRLHQQGRLEEASALYRAVLKADPRHVASLHRLSVLRRQQGKLADSLTLIKKAQAKGAKSPDIENSFGNTLQAMGRHEEAIAHFRKALALRADYADACNNLGNSLQALGRAEEAVAQYRAALAINPHFAIASNSLGTALQELRQTEAAVAAYDHALSIEPGFAAAHSNRGNALLEMNRHREAIAAFQEALRLSPNMAEARWNESQARLALGDYDIGWREYEWRFANPGLGYGKRQFGAPQWRGDSNLSGRTILLHAEQGLGDSLFFVRYAPLVAARGAKVILEVQAPLVELLKGLPGIAEVHAAGESRSAYDLHCPLPSLPLAFGTTLGTIPAAPYVSAPQERAGKWQTYLAERAGAGLPRIGVLWAGNPGNKHDRIRSLPLEQLRPILETPGCQFVILQKELRDGDAALLNGVRGALTPGELLEDFADTAALIAALDLVIAVDTSVAHLAGAMGKPVWVLLRYAAYWCWLAGREHSPWYPSAHLFRQSAAGDWSSVVAQVSRSLAEQFTPPSEGGAQARWR